MNFDKILIVKPSSLGDIIHSLPFLNALKKRHPRSSVHWVVARELAGILEGHPMVDRLWPIDKDRWKHLRRLPASLAELRQLAAALRREHFDLVVDLQGLLRSALISRAASAPAVVGFREGREGSPLFYTHRVAGGVGLHAVDRYLKVADFLGCDTHEVAFPLVIPRDESILADNGLLRGQYVVMIPGARWDTKRWPADRFGRVAAALPLRSVILGSAADRGDALVAEAHSSGHAVTMAGRTTLQDATVLLRHSRAALTNDTGTMHLAAALGIPVCAIFGPTDPRRTGPYGKGHIILSAEAHCAPCFRKRCSTTECMDGITVESACAAMARLIDVERTA